VRNARKLMKFSCSLKWCNVHILNLGAWMCRLGGSIYGGCLDCGVVAQALPRQRISVQGFLGKRPKIMVVFLLAA
jgi:hypothetical protein